MFVRSSLVMIFLNFLLTNVECSIISYETGNARTIQERKNRETIGDSNSRNWMETISNVQSNLLNVQAIIAKDEELKGDCMTGSQKTEKRHLMCAGSILNFRHVLTSATCIREATHIRHNVKAPLVVVIAPVNPNPQVIRIIEYRVHPKYNEVPYHQQHTRHNIAILRLGCGIKWDYAHKVSLPSTPSAEVCSSDNCLVAILRKVGKTSYVMYETRAQQIPFNSRRRKSIGIVKEFRNDTAAEILPGNIGEKLKEPPLLFDKQEAQEILPKTSTKNNMDFSRIATLITIRNIENKTRNFKSLEGDDLLKLGSNSEDVPFENLGMFISGKKTNYSFSPTKVISQQRKVLPTVEGILTNTSIVDQYILQGDSDQNGRHLRASDGFQGCPQSGSPVMSEKYQVALVSISCDDRQPGVPWKYTDISVNVEWILGTLFNWLLPSSVTESSGPERLNTKGCSTCIYNFFIDLTGSNDKTNCSDLNQDSSKIKMCASHNGRKMMNRQTAIPKKDDKTLGNLQLQKPTEQRESRQYETSHKINDEGNENDRKNQNLDGRSSKILKTDTSIISRDESNLENNDIKDKKYVPNDTDKHLLRNDGKKWAKVSSNLIKNVATDFSNDYDENLDRLLKMDYDQDFDQDFEKKFQHELQKDFQGDFKRHFNRDYDGGFKDKFRKDYYLRNMEVPNGNRLWKQTAGKQSHKSWKQDEYKNLNSSKVVQTMSPQQSNDYNPLSKKFRDIRRVLARIQKSIPKKNIEKVVFGGQREMLPKKEISNSGQGVKDFREEKVQPVVDRQFAVFVRDRERAANNHPNIYPGFNGYFI